MFSSLFKVSPKKISPLIIFSDDKHNNIEDIEQEFKNVKIIKPSTENLIFAKSGSVHNKLVEDDNSFLKILGDRYLDYLDYKEGRKRIYPTEAFTTGDNSNETELRRLIDENNDVKIIVLFDFDLTLNLLPGVGFTENFDEFDDKTLLDMCKFHFDYPAGRLQNLIELYRYLNEKNVQVFIVCAQSDDNSNKKRLLRLIRVIFPEFPADKFILSGKMKKSIALLQNEEFKQLYNTSTGGKKKFTRKYKKNLDKKRINKTKYRLNKK